MTENFEKLYILLITLKWSFKNMYLNNPDFLFSYLHCSSFSSLTSEASDYLQQIVDNCMYLHT